MASYSIKELEALTGIKAHTIRIWEQRYAVLAPGRTRANIRLYTEEDMMHLLNVSTLNKSGMKISKIISMSAEEIKAAVLALHEISSEYAAQIEALIAAMLAFDEKSFEKNLANNILRIGFEDTFLQLVFPFLQRMGILWQTGSLRPTQEHFASNILRQKIMAALDAQVNTTSTTKARCMIFLPEQELHEHSALFLNHAIRSRGFHTLYLGAAVPLRDAAMAKKEYRPDYILIVCTSYPEPSGVQEYLDALGRRFAGVPVLVGGRQLLVPGLKMPANVRLLRSIADVVAYFDSL